MKHTTAEGVIIPLTKLETSHLLNILRRYDELAEEGVSVFTGGDSFTIDEMWIDDTYLEGNDLKRCFDYDKYMDELYRRRDWCIQGPFKNLWERWKAEKQLRQIEQYLQDD